MEIVKNFGLDPYLFGAQVVNFLIIFYLLKRFMYKPILSMLKKREDIVKEGLRQAEEAQKLMEKTLEREKDILKKANENARKTVEEAKQRAKEQSLQIEENTKKQAEKILTDARAQIGLEERQAQENLQKRVSELSVEFLKSASKDIFSEEEQKEIMNKAVSRLRKAD